VRVAAVLVIAFTLQGPAAQAQPLPSPTATPNALAAIPVFAELAAEPNLQSYSAPVGVVATIHKFVFTLDVAHHGTAQYSWPSALTISLDSVPARYTAIFGELGDVQTWPAIYDLTPVDASAPGSPARYLVRGTPKQPSDVDHVMIATNDVDGPIGATWVLHGGWTITATIYTEIVNQHLLPKREIADIVGHGMRIHCDMTYGDYRLGPAPATTAFRN
jgi:hypothetical protein